ncbi:MAG: hypothetical protein EOM37_12345 [Proteobacteria bacterium]|nr:hypothetical protein [Pseudomonadota bacterium]
MSETKRRDITLGEMQDECKKYWHNGDFGYCGKCNYMGVCCHYERYCPAQLNLADPPRFNEAQMELLKALLDNGIKKISRNDVITFDLTRNDVIGDGLFLGAVKLEVGETLDIAELLGKDAT